jgi:hypothetical protein
MFTVKHFLSKGLFRNARKQVKVCNRSSKFELYLHNYMDYRPSEDRSWIFDRKMRNLNIWLVDPFQIWPMKSVSSAIHGFDRMLVSHIVCIIQIFRICPLRVCYPYHNCLLFLLFHYLIYYFMILSFFKLSVSICQAKLCLATVRSIQYVSVFRCCLIKW